MKKLGVYIHIPFCANKCRYCDYYSMVANESLKTMYIDTVLGHLKKAAGLYAGYTVDTVYLGGGTPSLLEPAMLEKLFEGIYGLRTDRNCEITIEVNPGTVDKEKVRVMKTLGINRVSIGAQSFCDSELNMLGRVHDSKDIKEAFRLFRRYGFRNIGIDLLFAVPSQTLESYMSTMTEAVELGPEHISAYPLKIEDDTEYGRMLKNGLLSSFDEELDRKMYHYTVDLLKKRGYMHYEISNFAKPGFESRHNLRYWDLSEYLGIGASAHSFTGAARFRNQGDIYDYLTDPFLKLDHSKCTEEELMRDYMMLGFRRIGGIYTNDFKNRFGADMDEVFGKEIAELLSEGLVEKTAGNLRLSEKGLDYANSVFVKFV